MAKAHCSCKCGVDHSIEASVKDIAAHDRICFRCKEKITFKIRSPSIEGEPAAGSAGLLPEKASAKKVKKSKKKVIKSKRGK